jgi:hypothetical protein
VALESLQALIFLISVAQLECGMAFLDLDRFNIYTIRTLAAKGRVGANDKKKAISEASPTFAHYACTELVRKHHLKFVITTNMVCFNFIECFS